MHGTHVNLLFDFSARLTRMNQNLGKKVVLRDHAKYCEILSFCPISRNIRKQRQTAGVSGAASVILTRMKDNTAACTTHLSEFVLHMHPTDRVPG
jgi:hypothetical protein